MTMKRFRDMRQKIIAVEMMRSRQAKGISVVTPQKLTETYQQHKDKFREETFARIRTIMIPKATKESNYQIRRSKETYYRNPREDNKGCRLCRISKRTLERQCIGFRRGPRNYRREEH